MGLTEELFECNFMTATKGNFLGLTKLLTPWIICFTKCTSHWKQSQWRRDSFPHISAPLHTTVPNKRQLVRLLWRDNDECGETWIFSPWEDIFVQTLAQPQSAQNIQDRYLFCLGLTGPNAALSSDLPQALSVYCEVYRMIFSWAESLPSNTRGWHDKGGPGVTRLGNINPSIQSKERWPSGGGNQFPFPQLMQSFWRGTHQLSWSR